MSHTKSSAALSTRLSGIPGSFSIQYEGQAFNPPDGEAYLSESTQPQASEPVGPNSASSTVLEGLYQVLCSVPKGSGKGLAFAAADAVEARFPRGLRVTHDGQETTVRRVVRNPGYTNGARYIVPVSIYYRAAS